ncbi:hypothetical protein DIPPA_10683 [Diplonema papillatum]|nr:hypothetical protein DIPPA_10683 [Diplonema papillatum]
MQCFRRRAAVMLLAQGRRHATDGEDGRRAARAAAALRAAEAQEKMQQDLQETGFVLVDSPADEAGAPGPEPAGGDEEDDEGYDVHYQDKKLLDRLRGTPGFNEADVKAMLPLVSRDPSLITDLQDMELASHFQTIAKDPSRAEEMMARVPKLRDVMLKIRRVQESYQQSLKEN